MAVKARGHGHTAYSKQLSARRERNVTSGSKAFPGEGDRYAIDGRVFTTPKRAFLDYEISSNITSVI